MSNLMDLNHSLDGKRMPPQWELLTYSERISVCIYLRMKANAATIGDFKRGRKIWLEDIDPRDRSRIRRHLEAIGELKTREVPYTTFAEYGRRQGKSVVANMGQDAYDKVGLAPLIWQQEASRLHCDYRAAHPQITHVWIDEVSKMNKMLYDWPNGGQRTLPSAYGRLRGKWMRANGVIQDVEDMNDGHIENILKLLQESHGNIQAKATSLLGKMHRHYQNQPEIQRRLEELCHLMEQVEVHQMYPIFGTIAQEQASRKPRTSVAFEAMEWGFDDAVRNW